MRSTKKTFQFPENYQAIIDGSTILNDFETFIQMVDEGLIDLSKQGAPTSAAAKLVNQRLVNEIPMLMKRPLLKSYPNVLALFLLFSGSGLAMQTRKGKTNYLSVNKLMFQQWKALANVDKYFYLVTIAFTNFTFELIGERNGGLLYSYGTRRIVATNERYEITKQDNSNFANSFTFKAIAMLYLMFGWISVTHKPPTDGLGWEVTSVTPHKFLNNLLNSLEQYFQNISFSIFEESDDSSEDEDASLTISDLEEVRMVNGFSDHIMELIPDHTQRLNFEMEKKQGTFLFKVNMGKTFCTLKIDSRYSLDELCTTILDVFKFDYDHLYDVSFASTIGRKLTFNGAPDMSFADYPRTTDILLESLPIHEGGMLKFTYDYGAGWEFEMLLERVDINVQTKSLPPIEVSKVKGKLPEQYSDEEGW